MMNPPLATACTAFAGSRQLCAGMLRDVAAAVKDAADSDESAAILMFDDATGRVIDLDLRGTKAETIARLAPPPPLSAEPAGRGRPKLGVEGREVTLLPRHWAWLSAQPGGASVTLRKLVESARRSAGSQQHAAAAREAAYRFMSALAGDYPGYEDAIRLMFAGDRAGFESQIAAWPADVSTYAVRLAFDRPAGT